MSSNGLTVIERNEFLSLVPDSDVSRAIAMNRDAGDEFSELDLIQVKLPSGGGNHWTIKGPTGEQMTPKIEGVVVFRCKKGVLWPKDETGKDRPVLVSDDMKVAKLMIPWEEVPEAMQEVLPNHELTEEEIRKDARYGSIPKENLPRLFWWDGPNKLPYCEFGSATKPGSKGKRAKDYQILYVLRKNEGLPIRMQLGPTAIQPTRQFFNAMTDVPLVQAYVSISLKEKDNRPNPVSSVPVFERTGVLSRESGDEIDRLYRRPIQAAHEAGRLNFVDTEE